MTRDETIKRIRTARVRAALKQANAPVDRFSNYVLDPARTAVPVGPSDPKWTALWARKAGKNPRQVAENFVGGESGTRLSTVFLGIDHSFGEGALKLFETMVFGGLLDQWQWRYTTWEEAETAHREIYRVLSSPVFRLLEWAVLRVGGSVRSRSQGWFEACIRRRLLRWGIPGW